jgi:hypothetical protein
MVDVDRQSPQPREDHLTAPRLPAGDAPASALQVTIAAVGLFAPGFASWNEGMAVLRGLEPYRDRGLPPLERLRLANNEARRMTLAVRIALEVAQEAIEEAPRSAVPQGSVFACSGGNAQALHKVLATLTERAVSPNQFAHVGHNSASGYWSILARSVAASVSIGAWDGSFAAGLLEAATQVACGGRPVLLVSHDAPPPPALQSARPVRTDFAVALLLTCAKGVKEPQCADAQPRGRLSLQLAREAHETSLLEPALDALRRDNPAARSLPLLWLMARRRPGTVALPYLADRHLVVHHAPC